MNDLKPCPFCGGKDIEKLGFSPIYNTRPHIHCRDCGVDVYDVPTVIPIWHRNDSMVQAWNTRTEPMQEIIHCEDCENSHFFYPWRYQGERSTVEEGTCALMAEGVTIERDGYCAFAERREQ